MNFEIMRNGAEENFSGKGVGKERERNGKVMWIGNEIVKLMGKGTWK
jgi:hypothetical protein